VLAWLLLLTVAAGLRALAWMRTVVLFNDGPAFLSMAEAIGQGRWSAVVAHPYHPLYPFCTWLASSWLGLEPETAAVAVSIAGGLMAVVAIHLLVRDAFGSRPAWIAGALVAGHPSAIDISSDVMSDGLYSGLFLTGLVLLVRTVRGPSSLAAAGAGGLAGLAYWVRPEGIGLLAVGIVLLIWRGLKAPEERRRLLAAASILVLTGTLVVSPYVWALERATGELALTRKKTLRSLALGDASAPPVAVGSEALVPEGIEHRGKAPPPLVLPEQSTRSDGPGARPPPHTLPGALEAGMRALQTALSALRYEVALLVVWGLVAAARRAGGASRAGDGWTRGSPRRPTSATTSAQTRSRRHSNQRSKERGTTQLLLVTTLLYGGLLVLLVWGAGYVSRRHALPFMLPWIGFAALTVDGLLGTGSGRGAVSDEHATGEHATGVRARRGVALVLIAGLLLGWGTRDLRLRRGERSAVREAATWLARSHPDSGPVAGQKLRVAYYAGAPFVPLPSGRDGSLESSLRGRGARWIVIDAGKLGDHLGLSEGIGAWLMPLHRVEARGRVALVLEMQPQAAH